MNIGGGHGSVSNLDAYPFGMTFGMSVQIASLYKRLLSMNS